ncbi:hypothetical protein [Arthrobacter luteolus]|uniref:hypothetical protein n=1 Tax=Arthrobacter luteolus TaxID=98672 RepID=UPI00082C5BCE|nr:hypothetical protein [Arthrobacter luteolus]
MNTRTARLIRLGILAARDPERMQHIRAAHPAVRKAARRELDRMEWRQELADAHARRWMLAAINSDNPEQIRRFNA